MKNIILKPKFTLISLIFGAVIFLFSPYDFKLTGAIVLSIEALILWGGSAVDNAAVSLIFLLGALGFSIAPFKTLFYFPTTENFYLIILSYIITKGVTDTGMLLYFQKILWKRL